MQTKKSLQRQTLPVIPAIPNPLTLRDASLLFLFGLIVGVSIGLTRNNQVQSVNSGYEVNHD
jgi:hypothetical protein